MPIEAIAQKGFKTLMSSAAFALLLDTTSCIPLSDKRDARESSVIIVNKQIMDMIYLIIIKFLQ